MFEKVWRIPGFPTGIEGDLSGQQERDRACRECRKVMKEILNVPDNIPQSLLDKADCVVVLPSVVKAAFGIGANYGRGVMTYRQGAKFEGHWGAPTMMALEGVSFGFQIGGQATDFVLLLMNDRSAKRSPKQQSQTRCRCVRGSGPKGSRYFRGNRRHVASRNPQLFASPRGVCWGFPCRFHAPSRWKCEQDPV